MAADSDLDAPMHGRRRRSSVAAARRGARAQGAAVGLRQARDRRVRAQGLRELGVEIVSTGGTARELAGAGIDVRAIEDFTGFPEIMDGRVKTLHPRLYAGLLARRDEDEHLRAAAEQEIEPVDLVCVNLYPFEQTLARGDATDEEIIENIDIGGPTMIRAAAKNSAFAAVRRRPRRLRARCSRSCASPAARCRSTRAKRSPPRRSPAPPATTPRSPPGSSTRTYEGFPPSRHDAYEKVSDLRYGENPHQQAAFYARVGSATHLLAGRPPAARQGAVVQQPARPQLRTRARRGVRRAGVRDRQAQQPVRLRRRRDAPRRLRTCLRVRPAERLRRRDRRQPADRPRVRRGARQAVHRGAARARLRRRRAGAAAGQEERAAARARRLARRPAASSRPSR